jgi:hypothetical protein
MLVEADAYLLVMARIWHRGEEGRWFISATPSLMIHLPSASCHMEDGGVFLEITIELLRDLEDQGQKALVKDINSFIPWTRSPSGNLVQVFLLDGESELEETKVAENIVERIEKDEPITLEDTGYRPLNKDEILWNRAVWQKKKAERMKNVPSLPEKHNDLLSALSESMGTWTSADELYMLASGILLGAIKEGSLLEPRIGRAYAMDGVQTITLELGELGFQIEIKVDGRGTQWDYQPQGWLMNTWQADANGYYVTSLLATEDQIKDLMDKLNSLDFVCDQASGR